MYPASFSFDIFQSSLAVAVDVGAVDVAAVGAAAVDVAAVDVGTEDVSDVSSTQDDEDEEAAEAYDEAHPRVFDRHNQADRFDRIHVCICLSVCLAFSCLSG